MLDIDLNEKINILDKIKLYKNTGYWNMKYIYLYSLLNPETTKEEQENILKGISEYYGKGDEIYDTIYQGLFNLYIFDLLSKAYEEDNKTKAWDYMQMAMTYCNNPNNNVFSNLYNAVAETLVRKFRIKEEN